MKIRYTYTKVSGEYDVTDLIDGPETYEGEFRDRLYDWIDQDMAPQLEVNEEDLAALKAKFPSKKTKRSRK